MNLLYKYVYQYKGEKKFKFDKILIIRVFKNW